MKSLADATRAIEHEPQFVDRARTEQRNETPTERSPEAALYYRLRDTIDKSGRFSLRLNDMAAGYAAGQNLPFAEARKSIEQKFAQEFGVTPHQYLDQHYATRRESARDRQIDHDRSADLER